MTSKKWDIGEDEPPSLYQIRIERDVLKQCDFDAKYGGGRRDKGNVCRGCNTWIRKQCSLDKLRLFLFTHFPILLWLPKYSFRRDLIYDVIAGLTVGVMHIPQGMAYGTLAGLEPINGLYTSFFPSLIYVFLGTSRHVSIGTFAVVSVMMGSLRDRLIPRNDINGTDLQVFGATPPPDFPPAVTPVELATAVTLLAGIILLLMGILRLGFLTDFLSDAVISGFTTGAALHVLFSQLPSILGLNRPKCGDIGKLLCIARQLIHDIAEANLATLAVSLICISIVYVMKDWLSPFIKKKTSVPLPVELIAIAGGTAISYLASFNEHFGVHVVGSMPTGFPPVNVPRMDLIPWIIADSVSIAIVVFSVTVSVGKVFARKHNYRIDPSQELLALGSIQCLCSFLSCIPPSGSLGRSVLFESAGTRTQIAAVIGCGVILVVLLWLGPLFYFLPKCILASIIIVALKGMLTQCRDFRSLLRFSTFDALTWMSSFMAVLWLGVTYGLAASVALGMLTLVLRLQWSNAALLSWIPGTEVYKDGRYYAEGQAVYGVKIFRFNAPLSFVNVERFRSALLEMSGVDIDQLRAYLRTCSAFPPSPPSTTVVSVPTVDTSTIVTSPVRGLDQQTRDENQNEAANEDSDPSTSASSTSPIVGLVSPRSIEGDPQALECIVVDCSMFGYVDATGLNMLKQIYQELTEIGIQVLFASCHAALLSFFEASDFHNTVPRDCLYVTVHDAVICATGGNIVGLKRGGGAIA